MSIKNQRQEIKKYLVALREEQGKPPFTEYKLNRKIEKSLQQFGGDEGKARLNRWTALEAHRMEEREAHIIREEGSLRYGQDRTRTDPIGEVAVIRPDMTRLTVVAGVNHMQHA